MPDHISLLLGLPLLAVAPAVLFYLVGDRQRRAAGGTRRRLVAVTLVGTVFTLLPLAASIALAAQTSDGMVVIGLFLTLFSGAAVGAFLQPPVMLRRPDEPLLLVEDPVLIDRVKEIAARMNVAAPSLRMLRSMSAEQPIMAFLAGLPAPTIIVSDGLVTRLPPEQRDATLCHELGHLANGTMWLFLSIVPLASLVGVVAIRFGVETWYLLTPTVIFVLYRVVSRQLEVDCDVRAARAIGFPQMANALRAIHGDGIVLKPDWLRVLLESTATHPSLDARLACLREHSPESVRAQMPDAASRATPARIAFVMGVMMMAAGWWLGRQSNPWAYGGSAVLFASILIVALVLPRLALWLNRRPGLRRPQSRWPLIINVSVGLLALGVIAASFPWWNVPYVPPVAAILAVAIVAPAVILSTVRSTQRLKLSIAWRQRDFDRVIELASRLPDSDLDARVMAATARAVQGDRKRAIADFESLIQSHPRSADLWISLSALQIDDGQYERAIETSREMQRRFPELGIAGAIESRACRRMGRLGEARALIDRAMETETDSGTVWAAAAGIAVDSGDYDRARELLAIAHQKTPGTPQQLIEAARLSIRVDPPDAAIENLRRAIGALEENPLMLRQSDLESLRQELTRLTKGPR